MYTKEALKEIKDALLGRTMIAEDGRLCVMGEGDFRVPIGVGEGAASVRILGMSRSTWRFTTEYPQQKVMEIAAACMRNIGRGLILREQPNAVACFIRSVFVRPVVMTFSYEEEEPLLSIYTGRSITSLIAVRRAYKNFTDQLPGSIAPAGKVVKEKNKKKEDHSK